MRTVGGYLPAFWCWLVVVLAGCQSAATDLRGLGELPPLDYAVLVTGGAFLAAGQAEGTFTMPPPAAAPAPIGDGSAVAPAAPGEPIPMAAVLDVLREGRVFGHVDIDADAAALRLGRARMGVDVPDAELNTFLQRTRDAGYDLLLVVEELQDGPIESQGINGRWPVTFIAWILLGLGAIIPDHTFESRATLRATLRELPTGRVLHDPLLVGGPIELTLNERSDWVGLLMSMLVPPFWIGDDEAVARESVRSIMARRLLVQLARDLKSESVRQRLRQRSAAAIELVDQDGRPVVVVDAAEALTVARLRVEGGDAGETSPAFEQRLLASLRREGERCRYSAALPTGLAPGRLQVLVGTIRGSVASATFTLEPGR
jgi:hypothetical protein